MPGDLGCGEALAEQFQDLGSSSASLGESAGLTVGVFAVFLRQGRAVGDIFYLEQEADPALDVVEAKVHPLGDRPGGQAVEQELEQLLSARRCAVDLRRIAMLATGFTVAGYVEILRPRHGSTKEEVLLDRSVANID